MTAECIKCDMELQLFGQGTKEKPQIKLFLPLQPHVTHSRPWKSVLNVEIIKFVNQGTNEG